MTIPWINSSDQSEDKASSWKANSADLGKYIWWMATGITASSFQHSFKSELEMCKPPVAEPTQRQAEVNESFGGYLAELYANSQPFLRMPGWI